MKDIDLYLFVPCDLTRYNMKSNLTSEEGNFLIEQIAKANANDLKNNYLKSLKRMEIGKYQIKFEGTKKLEEALIYVTVHPKTKLGIFTIFLSKIKNNANEVLDAFISNRYEIDNQNIINYLKDNKINFLGTPRVLAFSYDKLNQDEMISILACDSAKDLLKSSDFISMAKEDIAQYSYASVYVSEQVLLEVLTEKQSDIKKRIEIEAWEIFFMELIILQDASISRVVNKIINEFDKEGNNPLNVTDTDILDNLSSELSETILFLDFNNFIYPTTRLSAEKISKRFRIDKLIDKYNTYKNLLEALITIRKNKIEDLETNNMNVLLLILTLTQILPVLSSLFDMIINKEVTLNNIISFVSSISVCFILLIVFKVINKRKKIKYSEELLNIKKF